MNKLEAKEYVENFVKSLPERDIFIFSTEFVHSARVRFFLDKVISITVGLNGFSSPNILDIFSDINPSYVIGSKISCLHEHGHYLDINTEPSKNNIHIFKSLVISISNPDMYQDNYCILPHEISAELYALREISKDAHSFGIQAINKAVQEREAFGIKQKGQSFHNKETIVSAISFLSDRLENPPKFLKFSCHPYNYIVDNDVEYKVFNDTIQKYISQNNNSSIWKMRYDTNSYLVPFDLAFAISVNLSEREDIINFREKMKNPEFPLQLSDYNLDELEKEWVKILKDNPNLITEKAKELGLLEDKEPEPGEM